MRCVSFLISSFRNTFLINSFFQPLPHYHLSTLCCCKSLENLLTKLVYYISLIMRKLAFCICENKDADHLRSSCAADKRLCFCYTDSTIPLLPKSEISSLQPSSVAVQPGLCGTWSETPKNCFLTMRLIKSSDIKRDGSGYRRIPKFSDINFFW